jgi:serine O-acetyltransferase
MSFPELLDLLRWDWRVNPARSWDGLRARLFLTELRLEQYVYRKARRRPGRPASAVWFTCRGLGSLCQWLLCNSNIPGTVEIGRGLRLPHPQNIIVAGTARIGEFCTLYHNVSIAWNGFLPARPGAPCLGDRVLVGAGTILIGDIAVGSNVLIGAGAVVSEPVPDNARVTCARLLIAFRPPPVGAAEPGSPQHLRDPYALWR